MVLGRDEEIIVEALVWDENSEAHFAAHDVRPEDVEAVLADKPRFFVNLPNRGGTHIMIGPGMRGSFFYVSLVRTDLPGIWRPITGWKLTRRRAERLYNMP